MAFRCPFKQKPIWKIYYIQQKGVPEHWPIFSEAELSNPCVHTILVTAYLLLREDSAILYDFRILVLEQITKMQISEFSLYSTTSHITYFHLLFRLLCVFPLLYLYAIYLFHIYSM